MSLISEEQRQRTQELAGMAGGWTYGDTKGGFAISHGRQLPALKAQSDPFEILEQQYQEAVKNTDSEFGQVQNELLKKAKYELQKLSEKYQQERSYIESLKIPADQKRQKLLQLNNKYELAAITARSKVKPNTDALNTQRQQTITQLQQAYQQRQRDLQMIDSLVAEGVIKDPDIAKQKKYAIAGVDLPISAFREPTLEEMMKQQVMLDFRIGELETALETATGEDRKAIVLEIANLKNQRVELMGARLPEYKEEIKSANKLTNVGLQLQAGRKPGTMAEGIWQEKQQTQKVFKGASAGFTFPYTSPKKEKVTKLKTITVEVARTILAEAGGNKEKARKIARERGYEF